MMARLTIKPMALKQKQSLAIAKIATKLQYKSKANQLIVLTNELKKTKLYLIFIMFLAFF